MDAIDDSVLKEIQLSIQAIESSLFAKEESENCDDSQSALSPCSKNIREDQHDHDSVDGGDYDSHDDEDYDFSEKEEEDPASSEAELAAMMDCLVAELQAEIQEQILQDYQEVGDQDLSPVLPVVQLPVETTTATCNVVIEEPNTVESIHHQDREEEILSEPSRGKNTVACDVSSVETDQPYESTLPALDTEKAMEGSYVDSEPDYCVPVADYTKQGPSSILYETIKSPRKEDTDYAPFADYTTSTQEDNNQEKSTTQSAMMLQRFIRYLSDHTVASSPSRTTIIQREESTTRRNDNISKNSINNTSSNTSPSSRAPLETRSTASGFEKLSVVSTYDPDYTPVQDYTDAPKKQRRGKREKRMTGATTNGSNSTNYPEESMPGMLPKEQTTLVQTLQIQEQQLHQQHERTSKCSSPKLSNCAGSSRNQRQRRTNKHIKKKKVEQMLLASLMSNNNGATTTTTTTMTTMEQAKQRTKDEAIRLLAESKLWNTILQQAFGSSKH